jgi:GNAT superfamily N-acetyltransferase
VGQIGQRGEQISAPEKLSASHDLTQFQCGEQELDDWLKQRAFHNEDGGASRTYVMCVGSRVVGFYALAAGSATHVDVPGRVKRNMPNPVPVMVIGRLAIDKEFQRRRLGWALLKDAILRTVQAAEIAGIRAILVHAISESARRFYEKSGFVASPSDPMTLMITIKDAANGLREQP